MAVEVEGAAPKEREHDTVQARPIPRSGGLKFAAALLPPMSQGAAKPISSYILST